MKDTHKQEILLKVALISVFFDAYCFTYIGNYPITLFTVVGIIAVIIRVCNKPRKLLLNRTSILLIIFSVYLVLNFAIKGFKNASSLVQYLFLFLVFASFQRRTTLKSFDELIVLFRKWVNALSLYGIYQFFARIYNLPFSDIRISNHMVHGYNWTNAVYSFGMNVYRSNSIIKEPSFLGQFIAINLLLYIVDLTKKGGYESRGNKVVWLFINATAYFFTLSGTGFIIIIVGLLIYSAMIIENKKVIIHIFGIIIIGAAATAVLVMYTSIGSYLFQRTNELFVYRANSAAGFARFRAWTDLLEGEWLENPLVGTGVGTSKYAIDKMKLLYNGFTLNGFTKIVIECGIIGIMIWVLFIISFLERHKKSSNYYIVMISGLMIPYLICHETSTSNSYWIFLAILNCSFELNLENRKDNSFG